MTDNIIEKVKDILGLDDSKDALLEILCDMSIRKILKYLNDANLNDWDIINTYSSALILCIKDAYNYHKNKLKNEGIKQQSQGSRSVTFDLSNNVGLSDDVKACLPLPKVRVM